ncbi:DUF4012 domain-containing protein [Mycolicibacterium cosmeticum]|uniref:DUF4012 domain-containing protein n=1 Tax=Mycolicibacterium cosmeticum TaxID=258533 RepID=W9BMH3_MYCCO|nr:hypothetical protein BN977_06242 [Mycolicibacterium cosmeticum]
MRKQSRRTSGVDGDHAEDDQPSRFGELWRRRETRISILVLVVVIVGFLGWLGAEAYSAKAQLEQARTSAQQAKDALADGDVEDALRLADAAQSQARAASDATGSAPWTVAAHIPWLGSPFRTGQQISGVVLGLASDILRPSAQLGVALSPSSLYDGKRVDVELLRAKQPELSKIAADARRLESEARAISDPAYFSVLRDVRSQLRAQATSVANFLDATAIAAKLGPAMMGADGPRTYFMGFQTNAEARGTGGILGGFGILKFDNGVPTVQELGPNTELKGPFTPIDLGPEFAQQYGYANPGTDFRNSNMSPHFPYAAQIWKSMWAQQSGMNVDGVVALDPVALSYILGAIGPVSMPDGEKVTKDNVVELTESIAYQRFPKDQTARKEFLQDIADAVVKRMTTSVDRPRDLLDALGRAVGERRISVWSASPEDQKLLEGTPLGHAVPADPAPYAEVVINNLGGNKMDYYLRREIEYVADRCTEKERNSTVTVKLKSAVPDTPLPDYVAGSDGLNPNVPIKLPTATMLSSIRLVATKDAKLLSVFVNGQRVPFFTEHENGHPTFEVQVAIPPRTSGELVFRLAEPTVPGAPRVPIQPLVDNVTPVINVPACPA